MVHHESFKNEKPNASFEMGYYPSKGNYLLGFNIKYDVSWPKVKVAIIKSTIDV